MAELTEEAKKAIKDEFREYMFENQKILTELNIYRWVLRVLFVLLLGGSIVGIYKFQDYLDDRIANRVSKFDNLYLANTLAKSGQYRSALEQIESFLENLSEGKSSPDQEFSRLSKLSKAQRDFFFLALLESLYYIQEAGPDGEFIGKEYWEALLKNNYFRRDFVLNVRWAADDIFNNRMGNAYTRFGSSKADFALAAKFFESALNLAKKPEQKVANYWGLAFASLFAGDDAAAAQNILGANAQQPNSLTLPRLLEHAEYPIYERAWKKLRRDNFREACEKLFRDVEGIESGRRIESALAELKVADPSFQQAAFTKGASETFEQVILAYWGDDLNPLSQNLTADLYAAYADAIRRRRELRRTAKMQIIGTPVPSIVDARIQGGAVSIMVHVTYDYIWWLEAADGTLLEGGHDQNKDSVTWTFLRTMKAAPGVGWRVSASD